MSNRTSNQLLMPYLQLRSRVLPPNASEEGSRALLPFARWFFVTLCQVPQRRMLALQKVLFSRADGALFWFGFGGI